MLAYIFETVLGNRALFFVTLENNQIGCWECLILLGVGKRANVRKLRK